MAQPNAEQIFHEARGMPDAERAAYLKGACGDDLALRNKVEALLEADAEAGSFLATAGLGDPTVAQSPSGEQPGQTIGRYKLLEKIGEGGFGSVWAAEQREPVRRRVALKIIKLGMDTRQVIARFEAERQALAMMDHPNIAKVLDAGSTEAGRPYFVMELVKGVPILDYCDTEKLDTKSRLDLFMKVCHAIQHAHQKGIIHRDIKPSNVLVTMHDGVPVPKVIDFGIAKATNQELTERTVYTQHRQMIGTPAYMSPEQAEMSGLDIDTRSDIYSLGVLLYELLTGTTPFDGKSLMEAGFAEMMRIIREETPHKPSTRLSSLGQTGTRTAEQRRVDLQKLGTLLKGDLDWIVMKCLEKDRTRRYETANGLAADIQRHLSDEPVTAGPPSAGYRFRKFVKRNRGPVAAGSTIAALLVIGIISLGVLYRWAMIERARVLAQSRTASAAMRESTDVIVKTLDEIGPDRAGSLPIDDPSAFEGMEVDGLAVASKNLAQSLSRTLKAEASARADADARARQLQQVVDFQSHQLAKVDVQMMGVQLRHALLDEVPEAVRPRLGDDLAQVNFTNIALGELKASVFDSTMKAIEEQFEDQPLVRASLLHTLAQTMTGLGLAEAALEPARRCLEIRRTQLGAEDAATLEAVQSLGEVLIATGQHAEAESFLSEALATSERVFGDDNAGTIELLLSMARLRSAQSRLEEAETCDRRAVESSRRVWGDESPNTLRALGELANDLHRRGEWDEAEKAYLQVVEGLRRTLGPDNAQTISAVMGLASVHMSQGHFAEAEKLQRQGLEALRRSLGDDHPTTLGAISDLATALYSLGRIDEYETYVKEALERTRHVFGPERQETLVCVNNYAFYLQSQGRLREAEALIRESLEIQKRVYGSEHEYTLHATISLAEVLTAQGRGDEAAPYAEEAVNIAKRTFGDRHELTMYALADLGDARRLQGRLPEAEECLREALSLRTDVMGPDHPETLRTLNSLVNVLRSEAKLTEAEPYSKQLIDAATRLFGPGHPNTLTAKLNYASMLRKLGRLEEALAVSGEALQVGAEALGQSPVLWAGFRAEHGAELSELGRLDEAQPLLLDAYKTYASSLGDGHPMTQAAIHLLMTLYRTWDESEPGKGYDAKAAEWQAKLTQDPGDRGERD